MPRSKKSKAPDEAEKWQTESHARISERAKERADNAAGPSWYGFEKLATRPIAKLACAEPIAAHEEEVRRTGEQAARYAHRTSADAQLAAGFSPHRHSVTICGRPVQVTLGRKIIGERLPTLGHFVRVLLVSLPPTSYLRQ